MTKSNALMSLLACAAAVIVMSVATQRVVGQRRQPAAHPSICGNPNILCKTTATFQPHDLQFRVPEKAVIFDTELFYAVILKSVGVNEDDCDVFIPESERLQTQALFP